MRAIVQDRYGPEEVLALRDIAPPAIGDTDVLVNVRAAGVDPGVWHVMAGQPYLIRVIGFGFRGPKVAVRGLDLAGTVAAVGKGVTRFAVGDEVFGIGAGSFAELASAPEAKLAPKPKNLTFEEAAAIPVSGLTALQGLRDKGQVRPGDKVLIIGAAGGVGSFAVQLAKHFGAHVTGVCSTSKLELVKGLGADAVIDYAKEDFTTADGPRYDVILDCAGNRGLFRLRRALTRGGTLVIVGGEGGKWLGGVDRLLRAALLSPFVGQKLKGLIASERFEDLLVLKDIIEAGALRPVIDRTFALAEAPDAVRHIGRGHARGKVVVVV